jgi:N,N-dimethylformamidase
MADGTAFAYLSRHSVAIGEAVEVRSDRPGPLSISVERLGSMRTVVISGEASGVTGPCASSGHDLGQPIRWPEVWRFVVDGRFRGGLHLVVVRDRSGNRTEQPLVITGGSSPVAVLLPSLTWHLYNFWGGRSRYYAPEHPFGAGARASSAKRARGFRRLLPMSAKRFVRSRLGGEPAKEPFVTRPLTTHRPFQLRDFGASPDHAFCSHLAAADWRLCAWLDRRGIDCCYCTESSLPAVLRESRRRAVILGSHAEYWPRASFEALASANRDLGCWLLNFGGNAIFEQAEFVSPTETVCMRSRFRTSVADEARLTGVRYRSDGYATAAPYRVVDRRNAMLRDIGRDGQFGRECLVVGADAPVVGYDPELPVVDGRHVPLRGVGASGWELDRKAASGFTVVARGTNPGGGAEMVLRLPSGGRGGAFSASSLTFTGSLLVDDGIDRLATRLVEEALD